MINSMRYNQISDKESIKKDVVFSESELENLLNEYVTKKVEKHMKDYEKFNFGDPLSMHSRVTLVDRGYHTV